MATFLMIVHVLVCFIVVLVVLLQAGKGADIGATFGGSSNTLFGSRGSASFLTKLTAAAGAIFMITSLALAMITGHGGSSTVIKEEPAGKMAPAPAATPFKPQPPMPTAPVPAKPAPAFPAPAGK